MKRCPVCEVPFDENDKVVAIMVARFHKIGSDVNVAISHPERCLEIVHNDCYDYEDFDDEQECEGD